MNELEEIWFRILKDAENWKNLLRYDRDIPATKKMKRMASLNTKIMCVKHKLRERGYTIQE